MITAPSTLPTIPAVAARPAYWTETRPDDEEAEEVAAAELSPDVLVAVVFGEVCPKSDPHSDDKALPMVVSLMLELA